jgi:hypothetical protein
MTEEQAPPEGGAPAGEEKPPTEQTVPYERFQQANAKAKEAAARATALEKSVADLKAAMDERESAGLPELDRMKKDLERQQKRADEAEAKAAEADTKLARSTKATWIRAAAKDFTDPDDAVAFVDLDTVDDEKDAERAVKDLAKRKKHLLKGEDPKLPGRVLQNGRTPDPAATEAVRAQDKRLAEAQELAAGLAQYATKQ